jgi:hypothetical protein
MGKLLNGCGKVLQGFPDPLGPRFQLTAVSGGKVLVSELALQGLKGFLVKSRFSEFRVARRRYFGMKARIKETTRKTLKYAGG